MFCTPWLLLAAIMVHYSCAFLVSPRNYIKLRLKSRNQDEPGLYAGEEVWKSRRKIIRTVISPTLRNAKSERDKRIAEGLPADKDGDESPEEREEREKREQGATIAITAAMVAGAGVVLRLGGRGALISALGLDFVADAGIAEQVKSAVAYLSPDSLGYGSFAAYLGLWTLAKIFCVDAVTIVLALSAGVIFGGVVEGTAVSVVCSTLASSVNFYLARTALKEKVQRIIAKKPAFRAVDRAAGKDGNGFKTVLTLRLSPLLPIPVAAYPYVYGASSVSLVDFLAGTALGSIKPYALDAYLGALAMDVIAAPSGDGLARTTSDGKFGSDAVLLAVVAAVLLVGSLATQVASSAWAEAQKEMEAEDEAAALCAATAVSMSGPGGDRGSDEEVDDDIDFVDLLPLPRPFIQQLKSSYSFVVDDFLGAPWQRLEQVMRDEVEACRLEVEMGEEMPGLFDPEPLDLGSSPSVTAVQGPTEVFLAPSYPGSRQVADFEDRPLDGETVWEYTLESLLFTLVLVKVAGGVLAG